VKPNIIKEKSFRYAIRTVKVYQLLVSEKKEYILYKQLMRSGTSVGAMIRESEFAESKKDFIHKLSIAQKEINENIYWLELLSATKYLNEKEFDSLNHDAVEIIKLITSIIKSSKKTL